MPKFVRTSSEWIECPKCKSRDYDDRLEYNGDLGHNTIYTCKKCGFEYDCQMGLKRKDELSLVW